MKYNLKVVNCLDVILNLSDGMYLPLHEVNYQATYILV